MEPNSSSHTEFSFRHRIQEISILPEKSTRFIKLELSVDGKKVHTWPSIKPGHCLRWNLWAFPCSIQSNSTISVKITEKHRISQHRVGYVEYCASDIANQSSITITAKPVASNPFPSSFVSTQSQVLVQKGLFDVTIQFLDPKKIEHAYEAALKRANVVAEGEGGPLDKLGNARHVFKTILGFGIVVAEIHSSAKVVVGLFSKSWEHLEKLQKRYDDMRKLIDGLERILPFIELIKEHAQDKLVQKTISDLLELVEDISHFIISYCSDSATTHTIRSLFDDKATDQLSVFMENLDKFKEDFDRSVRGELLKRTITNEQCALIDRLNPAARSHYSSSTPCQDGTRVQLLGEIHEWTQRHDSDRKLLWLHGQAGLGKSSIAGSLCRLLDKENILGAHFFCKRDDSELRSPEHVLNTIIHRLAIKYKAYGRMVGLAIDNNVELPNAPMEQRYIHLIQTPLQSLAVDQSSPDKTFIVVFDALDECEQGSGRRLLLTYIERLSQLVPWLKVLVTSRPDPDIKTSFGDIKNTFVTSYAARDYDASCDILAYTQTRMADIARTKRLSEWPGDRRIQLLSERADGLFIWAETACKFIENGSDADARLEQILAGTQSTKGSLPLDKLYTAAIKHSMGDDDEDNVHSVRLCLGAVVSTASRTPLSVPSLEKLLAAHVRSGVVRIVVETLASVLYEDEAQGGVVRVYHQSFVDYLASQTRAGEFYVDPETENGILAQRCLEIMLDELRFNICGLETSHALNQDVSDLTARVGAAINEHLKYCCLHWSSHLTKATLSTAGDVLGMLLFGPELLYWIEVLSLLGMLTRALSSLQGLVDWISDPNDRYSRCAEDAYRFVLTFYEVISESTPHLYVSALALAPKNSEVAQRLHPLFPNKLSVTSGALEDWSPWLWSIPHTERVSCVAFSSDGTRIVSGAYDMVQVWDTETGAAIFQLSGHSSCVNSVKFSPNGKHIVSGGSQDCTMRIWNAETGIAISEIMHPNLISSTDFSPDSSWIVSGCFDGTVRIWDVETGAQILEPMVQTGSVKVALFSPNGKLVASCSDHEMWIWDVETSNIILNMPLGDEIVASAGFSPDSMKIVLGFFSNTLQIWDVQTGVPVLKPLMGHSGLVGSVAFSPDGKRIVSGSWDTTVRIWDAHTGLAVSEPLVGHASHVNSVAFSPNGQRIVSASHDCTVRIWNAEASRTTSELLNGHSNGVMFAVFSFDNKFIVSYALDRTLCVWNAETGAQISQISAGSYVYYAAFSPNCKLVISSTENTAMRTYDVVTGEIVFETTYGHAEETSSVSVSPDGKTIASGANDGTIRIWVIEAMEALKSLVGHSGEVKSLEFSCDGKLVVSGSDDGTVRIWDAEIGTAMFTPLVLPGSSSVLYARLSPDNKRVAIGSQDNMLRVWDANTGAEAFAVSISELDRWGYPAFSPNGKTIASFFEDGTLRVWDVESGMETSVPQRGHRFGINTVAFSPDGKRIVSASYDNTLRIWDASAKGVLTEAVLNILSSFGNSCTIPKIDYLAAQTANIHHASTQTALSTSRLTRYRRPGTGWVCSGSANLLWLLPEHRTVDDSLVRISRSPLPTPLMIDFSTFAHGDSWSLIASR